MGARRKKSRRKAPTHKGAPDGIGRDFLFATLPDELVLAVMAATGDAKTVVRLGQTCRRLYAIASDDGLWRRLCLWKYEGPPPHRRHAEFGRGWRWLYAASNRIIDRRNGPARIGLARPATVRTVPYVFGYVPETCYNGCHLYMGDVRDGARHGYGYATWWVPSMGVVTYDGAWDRGWMCGRGTYRWTGCKYHRYGPPRWGDACGCGAVLFGERGCDDSCVPPSARARGGAFLCADMTEGFARTRGLYVWNSGDTFAGTLRSERRLEPPYEWRWYQRDNAMPDGRGTYAWADGARYEGGWKDGQRHGYGVMRYADRGIYRGGWYNDERHGKGVFVSGDGTTARGERYHSKRRWSDFDALNTGDMRASRHVRHGCISPSAFARRTTRDWSGQQ
jgi:hypothetical protein